MTWIKCKVLFEADLSPLFGQTFATFQDSGGSMNKPFEYFAFSLLNSPMPSRIRTNLGRADGLLGGVFPRYEDSIHPLSFGGRNNRSDCDA
jgi:hypothetical protein